MKTFTQITRFDEYPWKFLIFNFFSPQKYKPTAGRPLSVGQEEPGKVVPSTTETKEIPSEIAPFNEKWNDEVNDNNDIIKRAKNMSAMAFAMYQFTKGNGTLRTTQDLFTQAEYFAEEANRLYKVLRQFSYQVRYAYNSVCMYIPHLVLQRYYM